MKFISAPAALSFALFTALTGTQASAQAANAAVAPAPYRVIAGDEIEIYVWGEERLQRVVHVLPDGTFSFPLVGKVNAMNNLPSEIEQKISKGLEGQYRGAVPQVTVSVRNATGTQFSVVGKVRSPGTFTPGRYINVLDAVGLAGGPTDFAQTNGIVILRKNGGRMETVRVRLADVLKGSVGDLSAASLPQLQGGDTVIVP